MADGDWLPVVHPAFTRWMVGDVGPRGGPPGDFWRDHVLGDPEFAEVAVCIELVLGGDVVVRIASREITTYTATGQKLVWSADATQLPEINWGYDFSAMSAQSAARSMSFSVASDVVDPASIMARGRMIAGIGEVSLQVDRMSWEERLVLLRGVMSSGVTVSAVEGGLVSFSLSDPMDLVDQVISSQVLTSGSVAPFSLSGPWDNAIGQKYPIVLNTALVPCLGADTFFTSEPYFVVCIGHDVTLGDILWINGASGDGTNLFVPVQYQVWDAYGVPLTALKRGTGGGTGTHVWTTSDTVHIQATANSQTDRTVLGMARHLLETYTCLGRAGLSAELWGLAQSKMGPSAIETLLNGAADDGTEATALAFVEGELLSSFPMIAMCWHGTGYGPIVTDHRLNQPRGRLVAGQWPLKDEATSELQELEWSKCFNNFTLQYDYDIVTDSYRKVKSRHKGNNALCQKSANSPMGERTMDTITSVHIKDDDVADNMLDWLVAHFAFPSYYVEYPCYPWLIVNAMLGEELRLTDPRWGFEDAVVTIERLAWAPSTGATIGLRSWHLYHPTVAAPTTTATASSDVDGTVSVVELLLNFDGGNGSTSFTDEGDHAYSPTSGDGAVQSTAVPKWGASVGYFTRGGTPDGSGGGGHSLGWTLCNIGTGPIFDFGSHPDVIYDFWLFPIYLPASKQWVFYARNNDSYGFAVQVTTGGCIRYFSTFGGAEGDQCDVTSPTALTLGVWNHVRIALGGGVVSIWQGTDASPLGTCVATGADASGYNIGGTRANLTGFFGGYSGDCLDAYVDSFYIATGTTMTVVGVGETYTLPTQAWVNPP